MTSTKEKGNKHERLVKDILTKWGYTVEGVRPFIVWIKGRPRAIKHDYYNAFDHIAFNEEQVMFSQVTDVNHWPAHIPKILQHTYPKTLVVSGWAWHDGRRTFDKRYNDKKMFTLNQVYSYYTLNHETKEFEFQHYVDKEGKVIYKEDYQEYCKKEHVKRYAKKVGE